MTAYLANPTTTLLILATMATALWYLMQNVLRRTKRVSKCGHLQKVLLYYYACANYVSGLLGYGICGGADDYYSER